MQLSKLNVHIQDVSSPGIAFIADNNLVWTVQSGSFLPSGRYQPYIALTFKCEILLLF